MSEASNNVGTKKKSKKRRKGKNVGKGSGGTPKLPEECATDMPKQVSEEDQVITTAKCQRCKGLFRQTVLQNGVSMSVMKSANWMCPTCLQVVKVEEEKLGASKSSHTPLSGGGVATSAGANKDGTGVTSNGGCNCSACVTKRENAVSPEAENDAQVTQRHWMEIRQMVRTIYRESMSLRNQNDKALIGSKEMVSIVSILSSRDPHLFFQRLETLAREYLLEVKVRLLEQLSCGFNSPQLAIEFIQMLLEEYAILCSALPSLLYLLKPVEACDSVKKLGMTIELMNKNIFRELIFAESFMSSNLPLIIAQLRLASFSSDQYHRTAAEELSHRYTMLDEEMNEICKVWKSAIDHLNNQHREDRKNHFERIRADGESFKQQMKTQNPEDKMKPSGDSKSASECSREKLSSRSPGKPLCEKHLQSSNSSDVNSAHSLIKSHIRHGLGFTSKEAAEWSELLFKCFTPMGEPDFQLKGSTAMQTITLHADMTKLDLSHARPCCHRDQMLRYLDMGLTTEEVVELTLKLSALGALGIQLRIEDLFDDEGFSLSDLNRLLVGQPTSLPKSDTDHFMHSDDEDEHRRSASGTGEGCGCLYHSPEDEVNFKYLKDKILRRHRYIMKSGSSSSGYMNGDKKRHQDFLQGMVMKIRFIKRLTAAELDKKLNGSSALGSYDKVQVKLTQLELSNVRMVASSKFIGHTLGPDRDLPSTNSPMHPLSANGKQKSDYMFVHTDVHQEFMDLLLEKRRDLDVIITNKEKARRETKKPYSVTDVAKKAERVKTTTAAAGKPDKENLSTTSLPHYQVQDQQEAVRPTSATTKRPDSGSKEKAGDGEEVKKSFKPLYQSPRTQPCQCSACIGAVATVICPNYRIKSADPSSDTITIECSLTPHGEGGRQRKVPLHSRDKLIGKANVNVTMDMTCTTDLDSLSPMSKEGLWQNWMSTSGSAQLESESNISNGNHHYSNHHHYAHGEDRESSTVCDMHEAEYGSSPSSSAAHQARSCSNHHSSSTCLKESDSCKNGMQGTGNSSGSGEVPRRYCLCSYCELFGHNGPPTAPTSQNYTKRRDIMRQKLEEKKKRKDQKSPSQPTLKVIAQMNEKSSDSVRPRGKEKVDEQTSVEELLAYIEGDGEDGEQSNTSKTPKKQKKKKKLPVTDEYQHMEHPDNIRTPGRYIFHPINQPCSNGSHHGAHHNKDGVSQEDRMQDSHDVNGDEYDDELEEFKKFCFDDAPVGPRKKIAVSLNMNDIMSKMSKIK